MLEINKRIDSNAFIQLKSTTSVDLDTNQRIAAEIGVAYSRNNGILMSFDFTTLFDFVVFVVTLPPNILIFLFWGQDIPRVNISIQVQWEHLRFASFL